MNRTTTFMRNLSGLVVCPLGFIQKYQHTGYIWWARMGGVIIIAHSGMQAW